MAVAVAVTVAAAVAGAEAVAGAGAGAVAGAGAATVVVVASRCCSTSLLTARALFGTSLQSVYTVAIPQNQQSHGCSYHHAQETGEQSLRGG